MQADLQNESDKDYYKCLLLDSLRYKMGNNSKCYRCYCIFEKSAEFRVTLEKLRGDTSITADMQKLGLEKT